MVHRASPTEPTLRPATPAWRGLGLGRKLVERAIASAESRGIHALYLLTTTAEHYFPSFGFERTSRDAVPAPVRQSAEFTTVCPASATVMALTLGSGGTAAGHPHPRNGGPT